MSENEIGNYGKGTMGYPGAYHGAKEFLRGERFAGAGGSAGMGSAVGKAQTIAADMKELENAFEGLAGNVDSYLSRTEQFRVMAPKEVEDPERPHPMRSTLSTQIQRLAGMVDNLSRDVRRALETLET